MIFPQKCTRIFTLPNRESKIENRKLKMFTLIEHSSVCSSFIRNIQETRVFENNSWILFLFYLWMKLVIFRTIVLLNNFLHILIILTQSVQW